jgi:hypothetical protein
MLIGANIAMQQQITSDKPTLSDEDVSKQCEGKAPQFRWGEWLGLALILMVAGCLRLWNIDTRPGYEWDEPVYTSVASHFAHYGTLDYKGPVGVNTLYLAHPPFYFVMLGLWFRLIGIGIVQARILSVMMSLLTCSVLFLYLRERMSKWALLPVLFIAVDGWFVFANRISWIDNTVVFFGILGLWAYSHALKSNKILEFVLAGFLLGFTLVFKQLGIYYAAVPLMNWLLSRERGKGHGILLGMIFLCAMAYISVMSALFTVHGQNQYFMQTWAQVNRALGAVTSRGNVIGVNQIMAALIGQYRIFVFTVALCLTSFVWLIIDAYRSIKHRNPEWLRRYSLEISWILVGILIFIFIQIKFPNYFIYLMIPLFVYLAMRFVDTMQPQIASDVQHHQRISVTLILLLFVAICLEIGASYQRLVLHQDNALLQVADYANAHIPASATILADEPVGTLVPQAYCKLEAAAKCPHVTWIITYTSLTQHLPTKTSDPKLYTLLAQSSAVVIFTGFKETITVYEVHQIP